MNRREFLQASGAVTLAFGLDAFAGITPSAHNKPNIILCMTDDQGWGDTGYNGLKQIETPSIDALAAEGIRFDRFYAAHPNCSPTRASVLTGRHPYRMNLLVPGMKLRTQEITIAQAVKTAGYRSAHFGKWHLSGGEHGAGRPLQKLDPLHPGKFGFDEWFSVSNYFETDWVFSRNGELVQTFGDGSDAIVAEALQFISRCVAQNTPFFALIWYGSPHTPLRPTPEDLKAAGGSAYYGEMVGVDRSLGTLQEGLRKLGIADNTMLWFNSDNGADINQRSKSHSHGSNGALRGGKDELWEGGIRVPGIVKWPARIRKPFTTSIPVVTSDIYPTIIDILKLDKHFKTRPLDGISLLPLLDGQIEERPKPIGFWVADDNKSLKDAHAAWINNKFKLHQVPDHGPVRSVLDKKFELYDLDVDASEKSDVATQYPEIVRRMRAELENWQQSVLRSNRGEDYEDKALLKEDEVYHEEL
jgi:arylsulfatase A-like enzyme